jgi:hypothetical protein
MFEDVVRSIDAAHARVGAAQRELLALVPVADRQEVWRGDGARDLAHWLSMRYGISGWKAHRWIGAAHALEELPRLSEALSTGELGIDKVSELCRFATPETEDRLIRWAQRVSYGAVRHRGDLEVRRSREETVQVERDRSVSWWWSDEGRRFGLEAELPAAQGAIVARALARMAEQVPVMPGEDASHDAPARRADALVALCSAKIASDPDPDRATVVVHAQLGGLLWGSGGSELEDGPAISPETARGLLCSSRTQTVVEDRQGNVATIEPLTRQPPAWMLRQVRHRDRGCRFPGCGTKAFTEAHHIRWFSRGGRTELGNLILICSFHHRLVHEYGWRIERDLDGTAWWLRPDGVRYRAGPSRGANEGWEPTLAAVG